MLNDKQVPDQQRHKTGPCRLQIRDEASLKGVVNTPSVLKPEDGAGSGDMSYLKSDDLGVEDVGGDPTKLTVGNGSLTLAKLPNSRACWMTDGNTRASGAYSARPSELVSSELKVLTVLLLLSLPSLTQTRSAVFQSGR